MLNGNEVAEALASTLGSIQGLRTYAYMPDTFNPPGAVVGQPDILLDGVERTFCSALWDFPLHLVTNRTSERQAQSDLYGFLDAIIKAVDQDPTLGDVAQQARVLDARPETVSVNGQEFPGYVIRTQVLA